MSRAVNSPRLAVRLVRIIRNIFGAFLVLLIGVVALVFSGIGNQIIVYGANKLVPNLAITMNDQPLLRGGQFSLNYKNEQLTIKLVNAQLDVHFYSCAVVCVNQFYADAISVNVAENGNAQTPEKASPLPQIVLPFSVNVKAFRVAKVNFVQGEVSLGITEFSTQLQAHNNDLLVEQLIAKHIKIGLPAQETPTPKQSAAPITMPEISPVVFVSPLNWLINRLQISQFTLEQGEQTHELSDIALSASQQASDVNIKHFSFTYQELNTELAGKLSLANQNPLKLAVTVTHPEHSLSVNMAGDLAALTIKTELTGQYSASLHGSASLLSEQLPFEFTALSEHLEVKQENNAIAVNNVHIVANGDLNGFNYSLNTGLKVTELPALQVNSRGSGRFSELNIEQLDVTSEKSDLTLAGKVNWQQGVEAAVSVLSENISIEEFVPSVASNLAVKGDFSFRADHNQWHLKIPTMAIAGQVNNAPIDATLSMTLDDSLKATISALNVTSDKNQLTLQGEVTEQWNIIGNLNLANPETLDPRLSGQGHAEFKVTGKLKKPKAQWHAQLKQLAFEDYRIEALTSEGHIDVANNYLSDIAFQANSIALEQQVIQSVTFDLAGDINQHLAQLHLVAESLNAKAELKGGLNNSQYAGSLNKLALKNQKINLSNEQNIPFSYHLNTRQINVDEHCWQGTNTAFCLAPLSASAEQGDVSLALTRFDLSVLTLLLPKTIVPQGQLVGHLDLLWQNGKLVNLSSEIESSDVNFAIKESFIQTQVPVEQLYIKAKADQTHVALDANVTSSVIGNIIGDIDIADVTGTRALTGSVKLQALDFANLTGFSQQIDKLTGQLNADISFSGSALSPKANGSLSLAGFSFLAPWTPLSVEQGNMNIAFDNHSASLTGQLFDNRKGSLTLNGQANWQGEPSVSASINGDSFKVALEPNLWFAISPQINMTLEKQFANISGQVRVVDGRIKVKELPEGAVSVSDDELIVDAARQAKKPLPIRYGVDLSVIIKENVRIDSFGLRSKLKGDVLFKKVDDTPLIATGELALLEGYYRGLGQELQIERGQIAFNGALDKPLLNVRAIRNPDLTEDGVIAGIKLTGDVEQPRLEVFSDPKMDQAMALSYLLSGRPLSDSNSSSDGMLTQLLLSRGLARSEGSITKIGEAIGIEDVSLSSRGSGEETKVEISGYVAPGMQVRYSIGIFDSMSEVAVRYQLLPKLYIEAVSGLNDSLDILYKFDWE